MCGCRPRIAQCGRCHHAVLRGVVFTQRCVGAEVWCRPHAASHGCHLRTAWHGGVFASPGGRRRTAVVFTCCRTAAVVFASPLLSRHCRLRGRGHRHCLSPSNQGQRGHIPSHPPANDSGGCAGAVQGQGINGATAIPLHQHGPCSCKNGEQGAKRGVPWEKRGVSAFNRGQGQSEGSHTFCATANGGGCAGVGRNAPASA
jgi:hypothetical protein